MNMNTCDYHNGFPPKISLMKIRLNTSLLTTKSFSKFTTTCMASHKQDNLPILHSSNTSNYTDTPTQVLQQASSNIQHKILFQFSCWLLWSEIYSQNYALHLIDTHKKKYPGITINCSGRIFPGINLYWDYTKRTVILPMPNYVNKFPSRFQH